MRTATIIGAGVFGGWIAYALETRGWKVTLVDQHGPASSRASSGGETRIIRSGYGDQAVYARWARDSMPAWLALEDRAHEHLFTRTGALFLGRERPWLDATIRTLRDEGVPCEWIDAAVLAARYPQLQCEQAAGAVFEPEAGVLFARRAVQALARTLAGNGVEQVRQRVDARETIDSDRADVIVFAAGPWLPSLFPDQLGDLIRPTRQEVFFFGAPGGDVRFSAAQFPAWVAFDQGIYGLPDLEHRGVKIAIDAHGPVVDPETMDRAVDAAAVERVRAVLRERIPALADAPLLEARVCQYENSPDGHFLLDRLPGHDRVWIAGGGSGHGFKHGPMIGRYLADLIEERIQPDPIFQIEGRPSRNRTVY